MRGGTMNNYHLITGPEAEALSKEELRNMYNDVVETIHDLQMRLHEINEENDLLWEDYEELSNKYYG
jgi:FtsZ-binding cell division protein ZapB